MKFLDKMILCIFSVLILLMAVISSACIFGWIDATGLYVFVTKALADQTTCNILLGLNVVLILFAIKGIFFESSTDEEKSVGNGIMLENDDGKLLVTKETITSIVNSVVAGFEGVKDQQSKITLDENNDLSILLTIAVSDQAVIKENGKYTFFGGRTEEVEKRTKVKARTVAHALENLIKESENILIMGHSNGDIDSMGSSLGIYRLAKTLEKETNIVNNTYGMTLSKFIEELEKDDEYKDAIIGKNEALNKATNKTLLIVTDTHKQNYVEVPELLDKVGQIVVIDHHRRSTDYIENATLTFQEVYASSAAELVTEILQYTDVKVKLKPIEVEGLYGGIMVDTKNFTFKTGVRTFEAAAYLRKCGVDIIKVKKWFQSDLNSYNEIANIVKNAEMYDNSIAIAIYDKEDKDANLICAKAADELLTISDITASFVLGNVGDRVCISGRSIGDVNVQLILEKLGGGGHITLAGAQVEGMTLEEVKQELINRINEYFSEIAN